MTETINTSRRVLVTGAAGFIGAHLVNRLLIDGYQVTGIDNLNTYYDPRLKVARLKHLCEKPGFEFHHLDIANTKAVESLFRSCSFDAVLHLAAQAGIRYSLTNPHAYVDSNLIGFVNVVEGVRHHQQCRHFIFASSSSVYGSNTKVPFSEEDTTDHPISLYAATKKSNEMIAHSYSHLFNLPTSGVRFFTVYGPWGRPDMGIFKFVDAIAKGQSVVLYNHGQMKRDFTYVSDIVESLARLIEKPPVNRQVPGQWSCAPFRLYNIGNNSPVELLSLVRTIEKAMGMSADIRLMPMQAGDVFETFAAVEELSELTGFAPRTPIEDGVRKFVDWYFQEFQNLGLEKATVQDSAMLSQFTPSMV